MKLPQGHLEGDSTTYIRAQETCWASYGILRVSWSILFPLIIPALTARNARDRPYTRWQLDQGPIRHPQRDNRSVYDSRSPEREFPDLELLLRSFVRARGEEHPRTRSCHLKTLQVVG